MRLELSAALGVAIVVGIWRLARWRRAGPGGPLPDVPDAPLSAEPIAMTRWNQDGIGTYTHFLSETSDRMVSDRRPSD